MALVVHDKVLRTAIEAYDGFLFSHSGDGFVAAFASPMSAVNAAIDAQRELQLPVRMGLATGEAELRDGDYFGTVLNRAARVMAAGHGGEILLAESTAGLLSGVDLLDLGPRRLRDVSTPVGVFQVRAPGLQTDFLRYGRSIQVLGTCALRPPVSSGATAELAEVQAALREHRVVALTGGGGGQDPCTKRSPRTWPMSSLTASGFSSWPLWLIRVRCLMRWRRCWASPSSRARA